MNTLTSDRKLILNLALPAVLQTVVRSLFVIVDAYWVGKLGSLPLAGLTSAAFLVWGFLALGEMIATGTNSIVAQAVGAEDIRLAKRVSTLNIVNTLFYTIVLALVSIPLLPVMYFIMNLSAEQAALTGDYLVTLLLGFPCVTLLLTSSAVFRGYGDTKTPFYLLAFAVALNFVLAPVFIFGIWVIPPLGIAGAALSTLVSYFSAFAISMYILKKRDLIEGIFKFSIDAAVIRETLRIGFPIALNGIAFSLIYVFVGRFVADFGAEGFASLGIGHRSESLAYQITVGFSLAATVLVGQNVGKRDFDRAGKLAWKVLGYASAVMLVYGAVMFIFSAEIAGFFINDESVIKAASVYNKIAASVLVFSAAEVVLIGAFSGAGDSVPPAVIGLPLNSLRIPLSAVFSYLWGLNGIWIAICLTVVLKGIIMMYWFGRGKWKEKGMKLKTAGQNI